MADIQEEAAHVLEEIKPIDPKFTLEITDCKDPKKILDKNSQVNLLNLLQGLPHGITKMSYDIPDLVETSTNLAVVQVREKTAFVHMSSRSSIKSALMDMRNQIRAIAGLSGATVAEETPYPGWKPDLDSKVLALAKKTHTEMFHDDPKVEAIHAGLECGIIGEKFPGMDMISIGPTIKYPHSPEEQVHISTVDKFYQFTLQLLQNL
jgi:dipeptidase D